MTSKAHTTAVIVSYLSTRTIDAALNSLSEAHDAGELEVVVVDNASSDETAAHVREHYPWVRLVELAQNLGFARGCNAGFETVETPYTLFLNPDAELTHEGLQRLHEFMVEHPRCGIAGPALVHTSGTIQGAGAMTTPMTLARKEVFGWPYPGLRVIEPGGSPFQTTWLCGGAFYIRSDVFREVGGMDPRFFLYFEETDVCRAVAQRGWELWAVGEAVARHVGAVSAAQVEGVRLSGCLVQYYYPSRYHYLAKHFGTAAAVLTEGVAFTALCAKSLARRLRRQEGPSIRARLAGGLFRRPPAVE